MFFGKKEKDEGIEEIKDLMLDEEERAPEREEMPSVRSEGAPLASAYSGCDR